MVPPPLNSMLCKLNSEYYEEHWKRRGLLRMRSLWNTIKYKCKETAPLILARILTWYLPYVEMDMATSMFFVSESVY